LKHWIGRVAVGPITVVVSLGFCKIDETNVLDRDVRFSDGRSLFGVSRPAIDLAATLDDDPLISRLEDCGRSSLIAERIALFVAQRNHPLADH